MIIKNAVGSNADLWATCRMLGVENLTRQLLRLDEKTFKKLACGNVSAKILKDEKKENVWGVWLVTEGSSDKYPVAFIRSDKAGGSWHEALNCLAAMLNEEIRFYKKTGALSRRAL